MPTKQSVFFADAVLFDMDGTLTDSIAAVEAAWTKVARDLGLDPAKVIAATHGKRAIDNLAEFKPYLRAHEMDGEVAMFEQTILEYADAYKNANYNPYSRLFPPVTNGQLIPTQDEDSNASTPFLSPSSLATTPNSAASRRGSFVSQHVPGHRPSFATRLSGLLSSTLSSQSVVGVGNSAVSDDSDSEDLIIIDGSSLDIESVKERVGKDAKEAWRVESDGIDRSIRILPGVKKMLESIPEDRYAIATSGAKTYAHGALSRVGITPPRVIITADDPRLLRGKPFPDPFLLAASCLGFPATSCVVFEDSPSGIKAGVASGATVIAVCTSHERSAIEGHGASHIIKDMECIKCEVEAGRLKFTVEED